MLDKLEEEFNLKLDAIHKEFEEKMSNLRLEFSQRLKPKKDITKLEPIVKVKSPFGYELVDIPKVEEKKLQYGKSNHHYYYSYNTLVQNYLDAYKQHKRNGAVRWFRQILVYFPTEVNNFLGAWEKFLIEDYKQQLEDLGYVTTTKKIDDNSLILTFEELEARIVLHKKNNRKGRLKKCIEKTIKIYPEKKEYILSKY